MKKYLKAVDRSFSQITKNSSGVSKTISGALSPHIKALKSNVKCESKKGDKLLEQGYVNLDTKVPEKVTSILSEELKRRIETGQCTYEIKHKGKVYSSQLVSYEKGGEAYDFAEIQEMSQIITEEASKALKTYYSSHFRPEFIKVYRNRHVPENVKKESQSVFSDDWHTDSRPTDYVKLFIALNEVTDRDGPFHVVDKRKTKELFGKGFDRASAEWQEKVWEEASPKKMIGPPGTAMLANTNTALHRAGHPAKGRVRDIALIQFVPSSEPLPTNWPSEVDYDRTFRPIF
jgi:hypothetical protein